MIHRAVVLAVMVLASGCTAIDLPDDGLVRLPATPRVGERATYSMTLIGSATPGTVELAVAGTAPALNAWGAMEEAVHFAFEIRDETNGYRGRVAFSVATREAVHLAPAEGEPGVMTFPVATPNWGLHPYLGEQAGNDVQRCALLPTLALPLMLAAGGLAPPQAEGALALTSHASFDDVFFPREASLTRADGTTLCAADRIDSKVGGGAIELPAVSPTVAVAPPGKRGTFVAGVPPIGDLPLDFPLADAMDAARSDPRIGSYLRDHPSAYMIEGQLLVDRPDGLSNVRTDEWILRFAEPSAQAMRFGVQRTFVSAGVPVDRPNVIDETDAVGTPKLAALQTEMYELARAVELAQAVGGIAKPTRMQWGVTLDPRFLGTPDETLWQVMEITEGNTKSVLVSANNGQLLAVADVPMELP